MSLVLARLSTLSYLLYEICSLLKKQAYISTTAAGRKFITAPIMNSTDYFINIQLFHLFFFIMLRIER